jgi:hypothetical protein
VKNIVSDDFQLSSLLDGMMKDLEDGEVESLM